MKLSWKKLRPEIFDHIKRNVLAYILAIVFGYIFFYRLDYATLAPWDEAWYASIAREIVKTGDIFRLMWNSTLFVDHPPFGYWLMAISYRLFGINEFSTRLPSAVLGVFTMILIYKTGKLLFKNKIIGFVAAIILGTSVWYVIRVRSGNLDAIFNFCYILTIYLSARSSHNIRWFPAAMLAFGALILSKVLVGVSALPLIVLLNYHHVKEWHGKTHRKAFLWGIVALLVFVLPWYVVNYFSYPHFFQRHLVEIGLREKSFASYFHLDFTQPLFYIHMGVRRWYYFWFLGLASLVVTLKFLKKEAILLLLWNAIVLYPFLTSNKTELWHLIPVYLPMSFIIAYGLHSGVMFLLKWAKKLGSFGFITKEWFVEGVFLFVMLIIAASQIKTFYSEVFPSGKYVGADVDISKRAGKYSQKIYLDDDYTPVAVFYSNRFIQPVKYQTEDRNTLVKVWQIPQPPFVVIVRNWAIENLKKENLSYKVLESNNDFSIISLP